MMTKYLILAITFHLLCIFNRIGQNNLMGPAAENYAHKTGDIQPKEIIPVTQYEKIIGPTVKNNGPREIKMQLAVSAKRIGMIAKKPKMRNFLDTQNEIQPSV
jgi:hypothetical protein